MPLIFVFERERPTIEFKVESQNKEGEICFDTGAPLQLSPNLSNQSLGSINSDNTDLRHLLFNVEMYHDYEMFEEVEDTFGFSWKVKSINETIFCMKFTYEYPLNINLYG